DEREVGEARRLLAHRLVEEDLLVRVREVVLTADDVGDPHRDVVADDAEVVERAAVRTQEREVLGVPVLPLLRPVDRVVEARGSLAVGDAEADGEGLTGASAARGFLLGERAARRVAEPDTAPRRRLLSLLVELFVRGEGAVRLALGEETLRGLAMVRLRVALEERPLVPMEAQPVQSL